LFNVYLEHPTMLPDSHRPRLAQEPLPRVITDYIAGMTDRYALDEWQKIFNPYERT
ncbi:MAG: deoxyguanosinetriphosphate triphosphohydrolase, partial [Chloroflexi bacterium]|nr:deoxyguanosinetriphosphate triphosphohydrolase [Chloroflexota bacterium]